MHASKMDLRTLVGRFTSSAVVFGLPACTALLGPPDAELRHEKIAQIVPYSPLPKYVDKHCLDGRTSQATGEVLVLSFRVGRGRHYQAFPISSDHFWQVGDLAAFASRTCEIRWAVERGN